MKRLITLLLFCTLFVNSAFASGFQLNEHGARAMAMAGAFAGLANDPSAIYFNPAGITQLSGWQFYAGVTMIMPISSYTTPKPSSSETEMISQVFTPINFYVTKQLTDKLYVGLSVNNQYGLGTKWDSNWSGKYLAVETSVKTFFFTPVVAYKFGDLSVSAGPTIAIASIKLSQRIKNPSPIPPVVDPLVTMDGDNVTGVGFTAGVLYKISDQFQVGASYRSQVKFSLTGTATSSPATFVAPVLVAPPATYAYVTFPWPNGAISSSLTTPQNITVGFAYFPTTSWTVTGDFQYVGWSSYDQLALTFSTYNLSNPLSTSPSTESIPRNYQDSWIARLGFEYKASDAFAVRFGLLYDKNPVQDAYVEPTLPDADRIGVNIGFGGKLTERIGIDFAYMFLYFPDRIVSNSYFGFNGTYSNQAHLIGLNLSYSLK